MRDPCQCSAGDTTSLSEAVRRHDLPPSVESLVESYDALVGDRDRFLWKWLHHLFPAFTLSCVDPERAEDARDAKLVASAFVAAVDDVAEARGDRETFEEASKIPADYRRVDPDRKGVDGDVLSFAATAWDRFEESFERGPRADEFADVLRFDAERVLTAIDYSSLANRNVDLLNTDELWRYDAYNMMLFVYADVDLAYSPGFDASELSELRRTVGRAQRMARIGNWITTWERELEEGDLSSGVIATALERNVVSVDELESIRREPTDESIARLRRRIDDHGIEAELLDRWNDDYARTAALESEIESVDVGEYLSGLETVLTYHLASRGKK